MAETNPTPDRTPALPPIPLKTRLVARAVHLILAMVASTWKVRWAGGEDRFNRSRAEREPIILCTWHNRILFYSWFLERHHRRTGWPWAITVSRSRDGDLPAALALLIGARLTRGSSGRGGAGAFRHLQRYVQDEGCSVLHLCDGSRGPRCIVQKGAIALGAATGTPLVPSVWQADRQWVLKTWDRFQIPKPFATITLSWGEPQRVAPEPDKETMERERMRLESSLHGMERDLQAPGVPGPARQP